MKDGQRIIASDGLMIIDGRLNIENTKKEVRKRNERYKRYFPHKVCDSFYFCSDRLNKVSIIFKIN